MSKEESYSLPLKVEFPHSLRLHILEIFGLDSRANEISSTMAWLDKHLFHERLNLYFAKWVPHKAFPTRSTSRWSTITVPLCACCAVLELLIQKETSIGLWQGVEICKGGMKVTHLQYADDTIIFCPPQTKFLQNVKKALRLFQLASGLQVNFFKSSLISLHVPKSWSQVASDSLLSKKGSLPFIYLGLPVGGISSRIKLWDPIIKRLNDKLASWKAAFSR